MSVTIHQSSADGTLHEPVTYASMAEADAALTAPQAPATPAAAPSDPETPDDPPAPADAPAAAPDGETDAALDPEHPDDTPEVRERKVSRNQQYKNRIAREQEIAEQHRQRAERAEAEVQRMRQMAAAPPPPVPRAEAAPEAVLSEEAFIAAYTQQMGQEPDFREYDRYVARMEARAETRAEMQREAQQRTEAARTYQRQTIQQQYEAAIPAAQQKYPDWDAAFARLPALPDDVEVAVMAHPAATDFAYYLATSGEGQRLAQMSLAQRAYRMGELSATHPWAVQAAPATPAPPSTTAYVARTPPPLTAVAPSGGVAPFDPNTIPSNGTGQTYREYVAHWRRTHPGKL